MIYFEKTSNYWEISMDVYSPCVCGKNKIKKADGDYAMQISSNDDYHE